MISFDDYQHALTDAVNGSHNPEQTLLTVLQYNLQAKAGYIPATAPDPQLRKNNIHWQSPASHMNAGPLWVFYATEYGHFTATEAKFIWTYGQILLDTEQWCKQLKQCNGADLSLVADWLQRMLIDTPMWATMTPADRRMLMVDEYHTLNQLTRKALKNTPAWDNATDLRNAIESLIIAEIWRLARMYKAQSPRMRQTAIANMHKIIRQINRVNSD